MTAPIGPISPGVRAALSFPDLVDQRSFDGKA